MTDTIPQVITLNIFFSGLRLFCSSFSQGLLIISQSEIQVPSRSKWEEMEPAEDKLSK